MTDLIREDVKLLCDVRKNPLSMKFGFSKNQLKGILEGVGIEYIHKVGYSKRFVNEDPGT